MRQRWLHAVGVGAVVLLLAVDVTPAWAGPGPRLGCSGSACVTISGTFTGGPVARAAAAHLVYHVAVTGGGVVHATLQSHQDPDLPAAASPVTINGAPAPAGSVVAAGGDLSVDLTSAGPLAVGAAVTVAFDATPSASAVSDLTSWASVTFDDGAHAPATSNSTDQIVSLALPELQISAGDPVTVERGGSRGSIVAIFNSSSVKTAAVLTLTFPAGLSLGPGGVTDLDTRAALSCVRAGATVTCQVPENVVDEIPGFSTGLGVPIVAALTHPIGVTPGVRATIEPVGLPDADPSNNSTIIPVTVLGLAGLTYRVSLPSTGQSFSGTGAATIPFGQPVILTVTITNTGPDPAPDTVINFGLRAFVAADFAIANVGSAPGPSRSGFESSSVGTLAPGQSVSRSVRITGLRLHATESFAVRTGGTPRSFDTVNQGCDALCDFAVSVRLTVVAAPGSSTPGGSNGSGGALANSGAPTGQLALLGLALLVAGSAVTAAARRRRHVS